MQTGSENRAEGINGRFCRKCLTMQDNPEAYALVEKEKQRIKVTDRTPQEEYKRRIEVCETCDRLIAGTCMACGCYVELRAAFKNGSCPRKKWKNGN